MNILHVSSVWPFQKRVGVALAAAQHVRLLAELDHRVWIVGTCELSTNPKIDLPIAGYFFVSAQGSGSLYSIAKVNQEQVRVSLFSSQPDLVIVEAWQTSLTEAFVDIAYAHRIPVLMISHGIAVSPYQYDIAGIVRSIGWLPYRLFSLPKRLQRLSALTSLDIEAKSNRFLDRDIGFRLGIPIIRLVNSAFNAYEAYLPLHHRTRQVLVVGYFSPVKNQIAAVKIASLLFNYDITFLFVGPQQGSYYEKCVKYSHQLGLDNKIKFLADSDCDLAKEIASSLVLLSTSITEAQPITLIESMAAGTPFVARPVGAISAFKGGILGLSIEEQANAIIDIIKSNDLWGKLSHEGLKIYNNEYHPNHVKRQISKAVAAAID